ncbi:hypothetical protein BT69DRAFT_157193 [Atractiella rhizophila]|nr:hypothetical protein BT69DRAFT_454485 [Atractiella rhizophila]KAH8923457.1 hypothetical protein BT69DRAFT_157193 [Atractiella rhizophila]
MVHRRKVGCGCRWLGALDVLRTPSTSVSGICGLATNGKERAHHYILFCSDWYFAPSVI